ncbi:DUF5980 family protein [Umezawaea endophytica]|uniref:DUF5980 family protein n=1 Tax=Umezawaea endophytica TaxID=1654476 RepID=A0A9X3AD56_9PSEU|nr:DUF5980 family protein [Umezawaea endophytica]MCS7475772.1 DUF5980 family protein [Umezawaea endophytica]
MRSTRSAVRLLVGLVAILMLMGSAPALASSGGGTKPTWELRDIDQQMCVTSDYGHPNTYYVAPVFGTWSRTIQTGIRKLPPGSSSMGGTTLPPGSNTGSVIVGFVHVSIAPAPVGVYTPEVWATDGVVTQAVPVKLEILDDCYP